MAEQRNCSGISRCVQAYGLRVETSAQPHCPDAGEPQSQRASASRGERHRGAVPQQCSTKGIGHHQATFLRNKHLRKVVRHREIKTIGKFAVGRPFAIGAEIGDRRLDLHNYQVASFAEREDVGAPPVREREFDEACVAELIEGAADTPSEERGGRDGLDIERNGHGRTHMISGKDQSGEINGE